MCVYWWMFGWHLLSSCMSAYIVIQFGSFSWNAVYLWWENVSMNIKVCLYTIVKCLILWTEGPMNDVITQCPLCSINSCITETNEINHSEDSKTGKKKYSDVTFSQTFLSRILAHKTFLFNWMFLMAPQGLPNSCLSIFCLCLSRHAGKQYFVYAGWK